MILLVLSELRGLEREQRSLIFFVDMHKFRHMQFRIGSWIESELCPYSDNKIFVPSCQIIKYTPCRKIILPRVAKADVGKITWSKKRKTASFLSLFIVL